MVFSGRKMQSNEIIGDVQQSERNNWGKTIEDKIRDASPYPISYDVDSTQNSDFSEFSYTEFLGGVYLNTQSIEINTRLIKLASKVKANDDNNLLELKNITQDKYILNEVELDESEYPKHVGFMVGHNLFDLVSKETLSRVAFENKDFCLKLHPITCEEYGRLVANVVGWNRIIDKNLSGVRLVENCDVAYVTTATELATVAVLNNKEVINLSNFFKESIGAYYPINTLYFKEKEKEKRIDIINNILNCKWSGVLFPWMDDIDERIEAYFDKALELKELHSDMATKSDLKKISTTPDKPNG